MKRIAVSCLWPVCGLNAFCLWLAAAGPVAAQDAAQLQAELEKSKAVIQQLQAEKAALQDESAKARAVAQQMQAQVAQLQAELKQARAGILQLQAERANPETEVGRLRAELVDSQKEVIRLKYQVEVSESQARHLQADLVRLMTRDAAKPPAEKPAAKPPAGDPPPKPQDLPPKLDGVIRAIDGEMIEISLGADDGLKVGHRLEIYRIVGDQGVYVGRMELAKTAATAAVGKMVPGFEKKTPQKGDRVVTRM